MPLHRGESPPHLRGSRAEAGEGEAAARGGLMYVTGPKARAAVMGIVNVTPDSFSDGNQFFDPAAAVERMLALEAAGADMLDVGGQSTRPFADVIEGADEAARVVPVIAAAREAGVRVRCRCLQSVCVLARADTCVCVQTGYTLRTPGADFCGHVPGECGAGGGGGRGGYDQRRVGGAVGCADGA